MATLITSRSESVWHYLNPVAMMRNLWQHRDLIRQFTKRDIEGRYRGSFLGLFWSFINPLIMLLIYTFVFGIIFQARLPEARTGSLGEFAVVIFCGLTAFNIFSECVNRAPTLIIGVPNYVKKVVFPLEILPVSTLGAALFHGSISFIILLIAHLLTNGIFYWTLLLLPIVLLPLICLGLGLGWFLASLGVFFRDISYVTTLVVQTLFFITPIFYILDAVPLSVRGFIQANPLTSVIDDVRRVVLWGQQPNWPFFYIVLAVCVLLMILGYTWFMKTKKAFADVM
ncbi:MAG: ABC transporter permease [Roseiflexaceae bacterium]|nr:ABC transporter permease [Roseiflexaceae bacterium]